jgi:hypothetical protein
MGASLTAIYNAAVYWPESSSNDAYRSTREATKLQQHFRLSRVMIVTQHTVIVVLTLCAAGVALLHCTYTCMQTERSTAQHDSHTKQTPQ